MITPLDIPTFRRFLQPLIAIDGIYLLKKYSSTLFVPVTVDANHPLFSITFGVLEGEEYETWSWFFAYLKESVGHVSNLTIVSDKMRGIPREIT